MAAIRIRALGAVLVWLATAWSPAPAVVPSPGAGAPDAGACLPADSAVTDFLGQGLDPARTAAVTLELARGAARFRLAGGTLVFARGAGGTLGSAAYSGPGTFTLEPPTPFERAELGRYLHVSRLEMAFKSLALVWSDSTGAELLRRVTPGAGGVPGSSQETWRRLAQTVADAKTRWLEPELLAALLERRATGYFKALIVDENDHELLFEISPERFENEALYRVAAGKFAMAASVSDQDLVCMYPSNGVYDSTTFGEQRPAYDVPHIRLDCAISGTLGFSAAADLDVVIPAGSDRRLVRVRLAPLFAVDSLLWDGEPPVQAFHPDRAHSLWLEPRGGAPAPGRHSVRVVYHGPLLESVGDWILPSVWTGWYPRAAHLCESTFDLTFHSPRELLLTSTGELESDAVDGRVGTTHWTMKRPTDEATFVIGHFEERSVGGDTIPPLRGLFYKGKPTQVRWSGTTVDGREVTIVEGERMDDWVPAHAASCVAFYQQLLGPAQVPSFVVAEIPALVGEAFPGLINIPQSAYVGTLASAKDEVFRAHEVAHQWWGFTLKGRDYHEHWLTEGFADFFGLLYLQRGLGHGADYLGIFDQWRRNLYDDRAMRPERGRVAGPLWLGTRNRSVDRPHDYALVDYQKGAWVLHMLRCLLMDLDSTDDASFIAALQEFFRRYAGRRPTTQDFQRVVERHAGTDLSWFFDQWVYGTELPTFQFAWRGARDAEGNLRVWCRVHRKDSREPFKAQVILRLNFGSDRFARVRLAVETADAEFELPPLPELPSSVVFNEMESTLCQVEVVDWK